MLHHSGGHHRREPIMHKFTALSALPLALSLAACFQGETGTVAGSGCSECRDSSAIREGKPDAHYLGLLESQGYDPDSVEIFPEGYVVEGDIFIPKADLDRGAA